RSGILGEAREVDAVLGEQGLVGGDDRPAQFERRLDGGKSGAVLAAHAFNEKVERVGPRERHRIVEPLIAGKVDAAIAGPVAGADGSDDELAAELARERFAVALDDAHQRRADIAQTGDAEPERSEAAFLLIVLHGLED